jgi:hypothetical protein
MSEIWLGLDIWKRDIAVIVLGLNDLVVFAWHHTNTKSCFLARTVTAPPCHTCTLIIGIGLATGRCH